MSVCHVWSDQMWITEHSNREKRRLDILDFQGNVTKSFEDKMIIFSKENRPIYSFISEVEKI